MSADNSLEKSLDELIDDLFKSEEESVEKADNNNQMSVKDAVDKVLHRKWEVQDVLPKVPKEKQDDVLQELRKLGRKVEDKELPDDYKEAKQQAQKSENVEKAGYGESTATEQTLDKPENGGYTYPSEQGKGAGETNYMKDGTSAAADDPTADEALEGTPNTKDEEEGDRGRPKEVHDVPDKNQDGSRAKGYEYIQQENKKTPDTSKDLTTVKSEGYTISKEDYELLQKAKKEREEEEMKKAREEQETLIKSAVKEATKELREENQELRKSLQDMEEKVNKIAGSPKPSKAITSSKELEALEAVEKSFDSNQEDFSQESSTLSKKEMLDLGEEMLKSGEMKDEQLIELENTGYICDTEVRKKMEERARKKQ